MVKKDYLRLLTEVGGKQLINDIKTVEKIQQRYNKRYGASKRASSTWHGVGSVQRVFPYERGIRLICQSGWVELHWVTSDCVRLRFQRSSDKFGEPFSYAVNKSDWSLVPFELIEGDNALEIRSSSLICRIDKRRFRVGLETLDHQPICLDSAGMQYRDEGSIRLSMVMQSDESSYGLGEQASGLMLRGKKFSLWNAESSPYSRIADSSSYNIPFYLGIHQNGVYGVFWDNSSRGLVDIGSSKREELIFEAETGELRYYLFAGSDVKTVLGRYTDLTGHMKLPPLWSLGYHISHSKYGSQEAILKLAQAVRSREVPCDGLHIDTYSIDGFQPFTWDQARFFQIKKVFDSLHSNGFKAIASLYPGIKADKSSLTIESGVNQDAFVRYPDGQLVVGADWAGICNFADFTSPVLRDWWIEQCGRFVSAGLDGILNHMGEPSLLTNDGIDTLPDFVMHDKDGLGSNHLESHNIYGMLMGKASYEGLQKQRPDIRPFNIIRAGSAGAQRYAGSWTDGNISDWDHLRLAIGRALNMGLSGAALNGPDVEGSQNDTDAELFTRWLQAVSLMPLFRSHSGIGIQPCDPWSFGQPYEVINRVTIGLRYHLIPYLYSIVAQCKEYGWPIVRPIFMAEPHNLEIRSIDDSFLLGDGLLVAPVLTPNTVKRTIYLPLGQWYDYWTGELLEGGQRVDVPAPLERLPLFVKAGVVLPHWPEMNYVGEKEIDTLVYRVYPGVFETVLYEDQGEGLGYEDGEYRWIYITSGWEENRFLITRRVAGQYTPAYKNIKLEIYGFEEEPVRVQVDRQGAPLWFYDEGVLELTIDSFRQIEITRKSLPADATVARRPW